MRVDGTDLYFSGLQTWPYPAAVLRQVDLLESSRPRHASRLVLARPGSIFDDFDVLDGEFMVAEFASWQHFPLGVGGLLSFSRSGALRQEVRTPELNRPSSVRGVRYLEPGDLLITEKTGHQLLAIRR